VPCAIVTINVTASSGRAATHAQLLVNAGSPSTAPCHHRTVHAPWW
jgi:hypothetical protein